MSQAADWPVEQLDGQPRSRKVVRVVIVSALITLSTLLWLSAAAIPLFVLPRFEKLFADFAMRIPLVTEQVFRHAWWIVPTCFFIAAVTCLTTRSRWVRRACLYLAPLLLILAMGLSVYFPYSSLVTALGGRSPW